MVHPPGIGGIRHDAPRESFGSPAQRVVSPYFSDESDSEKYFKSGKNRYSVFSTQRKTIYSKALVLLGK